MLRLPHTIVTVTLFDTMLGGSRGSDPSPDPGRAAVRRTWPSTGDTTKTAMSKELPSSAPVPSPIDANVCQVPSGLMASAALGYVKYQRSLPGPYESTHSSSGGLTTAVPVMWTAKVTRA